MPYLPNLSSSDDKLYEKSVAILLDGEDSNRVTILLENNSGQRNTIGSRFEDIRLILDKLKSFREMGGVYFDTCHAFAAGYDLRSEESVNTTIGRFDDIIGRDRHEHIGLGKIGKEGFRALCKHKGIGMLPFIMETPKENQSQDLKTVLNLVHTKQKV
jgi:deoxyribonuclease-4